MPSSDLILNVKQIAGYAPADGAQPNDLVLLQRGGLGGPYVQSEADVFVSTALLDGTQALYVGVESSGNAAGGQIFTDGLAVATGGFMMWNAYATQAQTDVVMASGLAGRLQYLPVYGWQFLSGSSSGMTEVPWTQAFAVSPTGYVTVADQVVLGRNPMLPGEAATMGWVQQTLAQSFAVLNSLYSTATVWSVNQRTGNVILGVNDVMGAGGAPIYSPNFQGTPTAPTPVPADSSAAIATTQWVWQALTHANPPPDLSGYAPLASPAFSGAPTAPTAAAGSSTGQLATTAFVQAAVSSSVAGVASFNARTGAVTLTAADITSAGGVLAAGAVSSFNTRTGAVVLSSADIANAGGAALASPAFSGTPTAPTALAGTNSSQLATCAFVAAAVTSMTAGVSSFNARTGAVTLIANDVTAAGGATLASPAFTGTPTAPTPASTDNSAAIATTAFVKAAIAGPATVAPLMNGTAAVGVSLLYARQDHVHPTDATLLPKAGGTITGQLFVGGVGAAESVTVYGGLLLQAATSAVDLAVNFYNSSGGSAGGLTWNHTNNAVGVTDLNGNYALLLNNALVTSNACSILAGQGYQSKAGTTGAATTNYWNFNYVSGTGLQAWVNVTNLGTISIASDYRIKKDDKPLGSTWARLKKLRPISYTQADFWEDGAKKEDPPLFAADAVERWGFVAHELQDALIESAASGKKDAKNLIQSPNPWTLLAAVVKALQEAAERIEALEARLA